MVSVDWTSAYVVPMYKGKGNKYECASFKGTSLLSVGRKVYSKVLVEGICEGIFCIYLVVTYRKRAMLVLSRLHIYK